MPLSSSQNDPAAGQKPVWAADWSRTPKDLQAAMMQLGLPADTPLGPDQLRAVLEYKLSSPMAFDLGNLDAGAAARLRALSAAEGLLLKSLRDLFRHPHPPLKLLQLTKDFAKVNMAHKDSVLPEDVASVIYYTSIAMAWVRCQAQISQLSTVELRSGLAWALALPWLDDTSRKLLTEANKRLR